MTTSIGRERPMQSLDAYASAEPVPEGPLTSTTAPGTPQYLGDRFARSLAARDADALKAILRPDVDFRAMTPGDIWEATDAAAVVDDTMLGSWFSAERPIVELLAVDTDTLGTRHRVGYRLKVQLPDGDSVVEQQAYFDSDGEKISWLRIMCTGFLPVA